MKPYMLPVIGILAVFAAGVALPNSATAQDDPKIPEYIAKCNGGNLDACNLLGGKYQTGMGVAKDMAKSVTYYNKSCDGGDARGCYDLGMLYRDGDGVAKNIDTSIQYFDKSCDKDESSACTMLGQIYWLSGDVPTDTVKAKMYFEKTLAIDPDDYLVSEYIEQLKQP